MTTEPNPSPRVDPITLEIIRGRLASTIREMELLMERCAMSPFIKEKKDYFVGLYDTGSRIVPAISRRAAPAC
jgi:N-methylhydantoinase B